MKTTADPYGMTAYSARSLVLAGGEVWLYIHFHLAEGFAHLHRAPENSTTPEQGRFYYRTAKQRAEVQS